LDIGLLVSFGMACVFGLLCIGFPVVLYLYLRKHLPELEEQKPEFLEMFGGMLDGFKLKDNPKNSILVVTLYYVRRLVLTPILIFAYKSPFKQLSMLTFITQLQFGVVIYT
jgi:hypothetical protein